jgi:quercetin dioxygenase-like cupin family protein
MTRSFKTIALVTGVLLASLDGAAFAQSTGLTRTVVTKADVSLADHEAIVTRVDIAPGGVAGWHTHPGDEVSYVLEGETVLMVAGRPPRKVMAGEGFVIPAGAVHNAMNEGKTTAKLVGVYTVEKGKPLATPAPAPAQ